MNTTENGRVESLFKRQVIEVGSLASAGQYSTAIRTVKNAKAVYPRNIFIIALEKQLEKLLALTYSPALADSERQKEILGSIPTLAQRAVEAMNDEEPIPTSVLTHHSKERDVAFKKLKGEYFQLADAHMQKSEYQNALDEMRRVLILDPDDSTALDYQKRIKEFVELKENTDPVSTSPTFQEKQPRLDPQPVPFSREQVVAKTKQSVQKETKESATEEKPQLQQEAAGMSPLSKILLAVGMPVIVVALVVAYLLLGKGSEDSSLVVNSPVVRKPVASKITEPTVTRANSEQNAIQIVPDSQVNSNINALRKQELPGAQATAASVVNTSNGTPLPITGVSTPSTKPANVGLEIKSSIGASAVEPLKAEPLKVSTELHPAPTTNPSVDENAQRREANGVDPKTQTLAKLDVRSTTPTGNRGAEVPASISYIERGPQIIRMANPKYPTAAWNAGIEGQVLVKVQIGPDGKPIQAKILKSSSDWFNDAVIEAALRSEYSPGIMPTGPVTTWLQLPFTFRKKTN